MRFIKKNTLSKSEQDKLLEVAKTLKREISKLEWEECDFNFDEVIECLGKKRIREWGLRYKPHGGSSNYYFVSKKLGIVVKAPYTMGYSDRIPTMAIPTVIIPLPQNVEEGDEIWIQPLADVSRKAIRKFLEIWGGWIDRWENCDKLSRMFGDDTHDGNYAMFKGKPVVIDW